MAFIRQRGKTFSVIYRVKDDDGTEHQRSETFPTQKDADRCWEICSPKIYCCKGADRRICKNIWS